MYNIIDPQFVSTSNPESWKQSKIVVAVAHLLWCLLYDAVWFVLQEALSALLVPQGLTTAAVQMTSREYI